MAERLSVNYVEDIGDHLRKQGQWKEAAEYVQNFMREEHSLYLGIITSVKYHPGTDRYIASNGDHSFKVTNAVAQFLMAHTSERGVRPMPQVYAHMVDGVVHDVALLFLSRS